MRITFRCRGSAAAAYDGIQPSKPCRTVVDLSSMVSKFETRGRRPLMSMNDSVVLIYKDLHVSAARSGSRARL